MLERVRSDCGSLDDVARQVTVPRVRATAVHVIIVGHVHKRAHVHPLAQRGADPQRATQMRSVLFVKGHATTRFVADRESRRPDLWKIVLVLPQYSHDSTIAVQSVLISATNFSGCKIG